jgi:cell division septum initiation protein DivIVA
MNKETEIKKMKEFAASLGTASYCGPWLTQMMPFIESAIRSDVDPSITTMTLEEFRETRNNIIENAKTTATEMVDKASERAKEIIETAEKHADYTRNALSNALREMNR